MSVTKVLIAGQGDCGKSTFVNRIRRIYGNSFNHHEEEDKFVLHTEAHGRIYEIWQCWQVPEGEQFDVAIFMFDHETPDSLEVALDLAQTYQRQSGRNYFFIQNKCDQPILETSPISTIDIQEVQLSLHIEIPHISALAWTDDQIVNFWTTLVH